MAGRHLVVSFRGLQLAARSMRSFWATGLMIGVVTIILSGLATAIPRSVDGFLTDGVKYDVRTSSVVDRDITATAVGSFSISPARKPDLVTGMTAESANVWGNYDEKVSAIRDLLPASVRRVVSNAQYSSITDYTRVKTPTTPEGLMALGYDPRLEKHITLVTGAMPTTIPQYLPEDATLDVLASKSVATRIWWKVGETRPMAFPDSNSQNVRLVGIFEPNDADDPYWSHTPAALVSPKAGDDIPEVTVFPNAAGVGAALNSSRVVRTNTWFEVEPSNLSSATASDVARQVRRFDSDAHTLGNDSNLSFHSGLPQLLEAAASRNESSQSVLATIITGPFGLAVAVEILVARLAFARMKRPLHLLRARGASVTQRQVFVALPALIVGTLFAAAGALLGTLTAPSAELSMTPMLLSGIFAIAPAVLLAGLIIAGEFNSVDRTTRAHIRLTAEATATIAAIAAVIVLLQGGTSSTSGRVDVLAALAPLLLSLLGCVVVLRIYPIMLRAIVVLNRRRRGISAFFGTAVAHRGSPAGLIPVLALVVGMSVAVFSGILASTLSSGLSESARSLVGADFSATKVQVSASQLEQLRAIRGVDAVAMVTVKVLPVASGGSRPAQASVVLVDPKALAAVQFATSTSIDTSFLSTRRTANGSVPILASTGLIASLDGDDPSDIDGTSVTAQALPVMNRIFSTGENWVLADVKNAESLGFSLPLFGDTVLMRWDSDGDPEAISAGIRKVLGPDAVITTPESIDESLSGNPAVGGIHTAVLFAVAGAGLLGATALILTTTLDARGRRRAIGVLATLGLDRRQARSAIAWEVGPLSVVGLVVGLFLGAVLSVVVLASVDLRPFTAGLLQPGISVDPVLTIAVVGGFAFLVVMIIVVAAWRASRRVAVDVMAH